MPLAGETCHGLLGSTAERAGWRLGFAGLPFSLCLPPLPSRAPSLAPSLATPHHKRYELATRTPHSHSHSHAHSHMFTSTAMHTISPTLAAQLRHPFRSWRPFAHPPCRSRRNGRRCRSWRTVPNEATKTQWPGGATSKCPSLLPCLPLADLHGLKAAEGGVGNHWVVAGVARHLPSAAPTTQPGAHGFLLQRWGT